MDGSVRSDPPPGMDPTSLHLGGAERFKSLYEAQFAFVWRCCRRFGVVDGHVEDAVQDVFVALYRRAREFDDRSVRGLLFVFARRISARYRSRSDRDGGPLKDELASLGHDPFEHTQRMRAAVLFQRFVETLPPGQRDAFILHDLEQWSAPEIAGALGRPLGTIYSRLPRCPASLRCVHRAAARQ